MDALMEYGDAIPANVERLQAVRADQLAGLTPCRDWDVTALLTHLAAATGQDTTIDERVAGPLLAGARRRSPTSCASPPGPGLSSHNPVPIVPDSPAGERLVAFLGRSPHFR